MAQSILGLDWREMAGNLCCPGLCGLSPAQESICTTPHTPQVHQHITTTAIVVLAGIARGRKVWHYSISSDGLFVSQVILKPQVVVITHWVWF